MYKKGQVYQTELLKLKEMCGVAGICMRHYLWQQNLLPPTGNPSRVGHFGEFIMGAVAR